MRAVLMLAVALVGMQMSCGGRAPAQAPVQPAARQAIAVSEPKASESVPAVVVPQPSPQQKAEDGASKILGKWIRPDGGYVLSIRGVAPDGAMDCSYFNPNPIKVSQAAATTEGMTKVFVELRDEGYPGCTYKLVYDPSSDRLNGVYYQAAVQESYDVYFVRLK
jgi:hypothetical protein